MKERSTRSSIYWALALTGVALGLHLAIIIPTPLRSLAVTPWLIDDSFIQMTISRNLATGHGFSFDGISPTSGSPPLWPILTSPLHGWSKTTAAKSTMLASVLVGLAGSWIAFAIARRLWGGAEAVWALFLAAFLPVVFFQRMNGMETAIATCLSLAAIWFDVGGRRTGRYVLIGAVGGLAFAARADAVFFIAAIGLVGVARRTWTPRGALIAAGACLVVAAPVLAWNWHLTGSLQPANQVGRQALAAGVTPSSSASVLAGLLAIVSGGIWTLLIPVAALVPERTRGLALTVLAYGALYFATLVLYQRYLPDVHGLRYLNLWALLIALLAPPVALSFSLRHTLVAAVATAMVALSWLEYENLSRSLSWHPARSVWPPDDPSIVRRHWAFVDWLEANLPPGTAVALKDHGRAAYFTRIRAVDLAGILDPEILREVGVFESDVAIPPRQVAPLRAYLEARSVEYLVAPRTDEPWLIPTGAPPQEASGRRLYRIARDRGALPSRSFSALRKPFE